MNKIIVCLLLILMGAAPMVMGADNRNVHSFTMPDNAGTPIPLSDYDEKVLLIVNTASLCGYTGQYAGLQEVYDKYKDRGFAVLAFPANNFGAQEPGSNEEIKKFCSLKFKTTFPLFAKSSVKGADINPLYQYLTQESPFKGDITWNFNKFLVNKNGEVVARFDSAIEPTSAEVVGKIEELLSTPAN